MLRTVVRRCVRGAIAIALAGLALVPGPPASAHGIGWLTQYGSAKNDFADSVAVTADTVYVVGNMRGTDPGDATLRAYATDGTLLWKRRFGTAADDLALGVDADATGVYVAGLTDGVFPGQRDRGITDAYVARFTTAGDLVWATQFGTNKYDAAEAIALGPAGVSVAGQTDAAFPGTHQRGNGDGFVALFDTDGARQWVRQFGSDQGDAAYGVGADADGVYAAGLTNASFGAPTPDSWDPIVVAYAPDGSHRWTRTFGTAKRDVAYGAAVSDGHVYVAGSTRGAMAGQHNRGGMDAFVRVFTTAGDVVWTRQLGTSRADAAYGIDRDATGVVFVTGGTEGAFGARQNQGYEDAFVRALSDTGDDLWTEQFGTDQEDVGWSCASDDSGSAYAVGITYGTLPGQTSGGAWDAWVARLG